MLLQEKIMKQKQDNKATEVELRELESEVEAMGQRFPAVISELKEEIAGCKDAYKEARERSEKLDKDIALAKRQLKALNK